MAREYFNAYHSYLENMKRLSDAEVGRLFRALLKYSMTGTLDDLPGNERFVVDSIIAQIDRDSQKYAEKCEMQKRKAKMRWDAVACNDMPDDAKHAKEKEKEKEKENIPPLIPPQGETGFGPTLQKAFEAWIAYKKEKRQGYKPTGLKSLITQIRNNADKYGEQAVADLIERCMASNWQGIIFDILAKEQGGAVKQTANSLHPIPTYTKEVLPF